MTLAYLALQIRESNRAYRFNTQVQIRTNSEVFQTLMTDPGKSKVWLQGLDDPNQLSLEERNSFYNMMYIIVNSADLQLLNENISQPSDRKSPPGIIVDLAHYPGFKRWWQHAEKHFGPAMKEVVEQELQRDA